MSNNSGGTRRIRKTIASEAEILETNKSGAAVTGEAHRTENITTEFITAEPLGSVSFSAKRGVNMGNYEAVHIGIEVTLPCTEKDIVKTYNKVKDFVELRLNAEVEELEKTRDMDELSL